LPAYENKHRQEPASSNLDGLQAIKGGMIAQHAMLKDVESGSNSHSATPRAFRNSVAHQSPTGKKIPSSYR
jgi:hypothetical protein